MRLALAWLCLAACTPAPDDSGDSGTVDTGPGDTGDDTDTGPAEVIASTGNVLNGVFTGGSARVVRITARASSGDEAPNRVYQGDLDADCTRSWFPQGSLCDEPPTTHDPEVSTHATKDAGATWSNGEDPTTGILVIDACSDGSCDAVRFDEARIFQMFSDGKTTAVRLSVHPNHTDPAPPMMDALWRPITELEPVGAGVQEGPAVSDPTVVPLAEQVTRYLLVEVQNDGSLGSPGYVEFRALKLFDRP